MRTPKLTYLLDVMARLFLGAVFIYAAWDKVLDPAGFAEVIGNYQLLPLQWTHAAALLLPWMEITCGLFLITGRLVRGSALVVALMLIVFIGALIISVVRGLDIHCGCFTLDASAPADLYLDIARDGILLAIAVTVLVRSAARSELPSENTFGVTARAFPNYKNQA